MRTAIRGIGVAGGFGCGIDKLHRALVSRKSAPKMTGMEANNRNSDMPVFLCDTKPLESFINKRALRRVDHYSSMALLGSCLALEDAGMQQNNHQPEAINFPLPAKRTTACTTQSTGGGSGRPTMLM